MDALNEGDAFALIAADSEDLEGNRQSGYSIARRRLDRGDWPIYSGTKHKNKISRGSLCFIYIAGQGEHSQCFIAQAVTADIMMFDRKASYIETSFLLTDIPVQTLVLDNVKVFKDPIQIRPLLNKLSFIKNMGNWGAYMQGGCIRLNNKDINIIRERVL